MGNHPVNVLTSRPMRTPLRKPILAIATLCVALLGCPAGQGLPGAGGPLDLGAKLEELLGGLIGGDYDLPPSADLRPAVRVRLTQPGFDVVAKEVKELFTLLFELDDEGRILIPVDQFLPEDIVLPTVGNEDLIALKAELRLSSLVLTLDWDDIAVELVPESDSPAQIRITILGARIGVAEGFIAGGANLVAGGLDVPKTDFDLACELHNAKGDPPSYLAGADLSMVMTLGTDADGNLQLGAELEHFSIDAPAFTTAPACDTAPECQDGDKDPCLECNALCFFNFQDGDLDQIVASIEEQLEPVLVDIANELLASLLDSGLNGQPLVVAGTLPLQDLLSKLAADLPSVFPSIRDLGFSLRPSPFAFAVVDSGLNVTMDGGMDAAEDHPCATSFGADPDFTDLPQGLAPGFSGQTVGPTGDPLAYHIGAAVPQVLLNEGMWALAKTGVLCISVTSEQVEALTGLTLTAGTIDPLLPGLRGLSGGRAPLLIGIEPHLTEESLPVVTLGPDSLINVDLEGAGISLYTFVADRYVRVFEIDADVEVGLSVVVTGPNVLELTLDRVALGNVVERYNELLPTADLDQIVPFVVEIAMTLLLGEPLSLTADLGPMLEGALTDLPLTAVVEQVALDGGSASKDWLALYLTIHPKVEGALAAMVETTAVPDPLDAPEDGRIVLWVGTDAGGAETEAQWRVDGTMWRPFQRGGRITVEHPLLRIEGEHRIEVRARRVGAWRTLDDEPAVVTLNGALEANAGSGGAMTNAAHELSTGCAAHRRSPSRTGALLLFLLLAVALHPRRGGRVR